MSSESLADQLDQWFARLNPDPGWRNSGICKDLREAAAALRSMEKLQDGTSHPGYVVGIHWMTAAYERICAGESEIEVLADYGFRLFDGKRSMEQPSWDDFMDSCEAFLTKYPEDIFTGESGDAGPLFIVALRKALADVHDE